MTRWLPYAALGVGCFALGFYARRPVVETKIVEKEVVRWAKSEATVAVTRDAAEKKQSVRVVTRWLRPDGTPSKERSVERASESTATNTAASSTTVSAAGSLEAVSESRTVVRERPRLHLQGLMGIDAGLQRRWGAAASWRVAGPVTIGAWMLPGARVGGASVGVTF